MASFVVKIVLALCAIIFLFLFFANSPGGAPHRHPLVARVLREQEERRLRRLRAIHEMVRAPAAQAAARAHERELALANAHAQALANAGALDSDD
jgi:hypothetical protein